MELSQHQHIEQHGKQTAIKGAPNRIELASGADTDASLIDSNQFRVDRFQYSLI